MRQRIGLAGQVAAVDENLTGTENLVLVGRLCGMSKDDARARARQLLERFDLVEAGERTSGLTGQPGQGSGRVGNHLVGQALGADPGPERTRWSHSSWAGTPSSAGAVPGARRSPR